MIQALFLQQQFVERSLLPLEPPELPGYSIAARSDCVAASPMSRLWLSVPKNQATTNRITPIRIEAIPSYTPSCVSCVSPMPSAAVTSPSRAAESSNSTVGSERSLACRSSCQSDPVVFARQCWNSFQATLRA